MSRRTLLRGSALVLAATLGWHAVNFLFNALAARRLGPDKFGSVAAIVALLYALGPLLLTLHTVSSRVTTELSVAGEETSVRPLLRYYALRVGFATAVAAGAASLLSRPLADFLNLSSPFPLAIACATFPLAAVSHLQRGALQGAGRFGRFAVSIGFEAVTKLALVLVLLLWLWPTVEGAVLSLLLANCLAILAHLVLLRFLPRGGVASGVAHPARYSLVTLVSLTMLALLFSVDVLAAKRYLGSADAGLYAAVALAGKIVFFATSSVSTVLFPWFSARWERGHDSRRPLLAAIAVLAAPSAALVALFFAAPSLVVGPLLGDRYAHAGDYIGWMALAATLYAVANLAGLYLLSQNASTGAAILSVVVLAQLSGLYSFHNSIGVLIAVQVTVIGVAAVALTLRAAMLPPRRSQLPASQAGLEVV